MVGPSLHLVSSGVHTAGRDFLTFPEVMKMHKHGAGLPPQCRLIASLQETIRAVPEAELVRIFGSFGTCAATPCDLLLSVLLPHRVLPHDLAVYLAKRLPTDSDAALATALSQSTGFFMQMAPAGSEEGWNPHLARRVFQGIDVTPWVLSLDERAALMHSVLSVDTVEAVAVVGAIAARHAALAEIRLRVGDEWAPRRGVSAILGTLFTTHDHIFSHTVECVKESLLAARAPGVHLISGESQAGSNSVAWSIDFPSLCRGIVQPGPWDKFLGVPGLTSLSASLRTDAQFVTIPSLSAAVGLRTLRLQNVVLSDAAFESVLGLPALEDVAIQTAYFSASRPPAPLPTDQMPTITRLSLTQVHFEKDLFDAVCQRLVNVVTLSLPQCSGIGYCGPVGGFKRLRRLTSLDVQKTDLSDAGLTTVAALPLQTLHIGWCTALLPPAVESLGRTRTLVSLSLPYVKVMGAGLAAICSLPKLRTLDISNCKAIKAEEYDALMEARALRVLMFRRIDVQLPENVAVHLLESNVEIFT